MVFQCGRPLRVENLQEGLKKGVDVTPESQTVHEAWLSVGKGKQENNIAQAMEI